MWSWQRVLIVGLCGLPLDSIALFRGRRRSQLTTTDTDNRWVEVISREPTTTDADDRWVEVISLEPRISVYHNFLSKEECNHLIELAEPHLKRSKVFRNSVSDKTVVSSKHTSSEANVSRGPDKIIRDIDNRIAEWTLLPLDHGGNLQVIRYQVGQKCFGHCDHLRQKSSSSKGGERMATVLMYLSDVEEGGETVFPKAKGISVKPKKGNALLFWNRKAKGITVKPKIGNALLFWNMKPDGRLDPLSFHAASPVIKGNKWCCRKWFHVNKCHV